ncbi:rab GTPase-binding effector protein 1-like [Ptychodera flava]|uniref:rab GTPase-binding effector protein 1-like n=1 Tax=Ptychodera flava TaxID=63121 RepID=UPI00396A8420
MMKETEEVTREQTAAPYQQERLKLISMNDTLTSEVQELQNKIAELTNSQQERESVLSSVTKSFRSRVAHGLSMDKDSESLEASMKKAQKEAEILRDVVMPMEQEIASLKAKLKESQATIKTLEAKNINEVHSQNLPNLDNSDSSAVSSPEKSTSSIKDRENIDERVRELNHYLEAEKASRTDLEMYVAVLNTQKNVLQEEADQLRSELHEVCRLLEQEKREHSDLKQTWQMANDQFLESQRLQIMDMKRMQSVLTEEQQRQILELQKKDREREVQEKRVKMLEQMREKHSQEQEERRAAERRKEEEDRQSASPPGSPGQQDKSPLHSVQSTGMVTASSEPSLQIFGEMDDMDEIARRGSFPGTPQQSAHSPDSSKKSFISQEISRKVDDSVDFDRLSVTSRVSLTEAQEKAITGVTPEMEQTASVVASARARSESLVSTVGKRLVSEKEWEWLQQEVKSAREKLGRPCDMCTNYEQQLQSVQINAQELRDLATDLRKQYDHSNQQLAKERRQRGELEESLKNAAMDAQQQITNLQTKNQEHESFLTDLRQQYLRAYNEMHDKLKQLMQSREEARQEVMKLRKLNENLHGKRSLHTSILNSEHFQMPQSPEEMQQLIKRYRRDIISVKTSAEHTEESLRSEIMFLKERVQAEQHAKETTEDALQTELDTAREEIAKLCSENDVFAGVHDQKAELEDKITELQQMMKTREVQAKEVITALEKQSDELKSIRAKQECEIIESANKIHSLQVELDNSEAVQRDFVRLSQSLQVELEKIRMTNDEVRWQHEDDIDECQNCKSHFTGAKKKKNHCKHCGKLFCVDCLSKTVESGPRRRKMPVCDVCHTLLVKDSAPYFSSEPPPTT